MYILKAEHHFDSAHFLAGYNGKCKNIHGHRWRVTVETEGTALEETGEKRGMLVDFGDLKRDIRTLADSLDHALIIERNSLREKTIEALNEEGFKIIELDFRPTAENFAKYFYERMSENGYRVRKAVVYETPDNCAAYTGDDINE
jgi:6-pyruvoyltetrahydropterin/6-carboxytetrahydropterin synthase